MEIAFADNLQKPRRLILEVKPEYPNFCYSTVSESDGVGSHSDYSLMTLDEWLKWIERFREDLTGRQIREAIEAAKAPFVEPQSWADFRQRLAQTGDPFIR